MRARTQCSLTGFHFIFLYGRISFSFYLSVVVIRPLKNKIPVRDCPIQMKYGRM